MISELHLKNWKSFADAIINIDSIMFLIGTNASGKSNVLDAFGFLKAIAQGEQVRDAVASIRGGEDWIIRYGQSSFSLEVLIREGEYSFKYSIQIGRQNKGFSILSERLDRQFKKSPWKALFYTGVIEDSAVTIPTRFYTAKRGNARKIELLRGISILSQVEVLQVLKEVKESAKIVSETLKGVFILNPDANSMRSYAPLSQDLHSNGSNIAGVIAGMDSDMKEDIEKKLTRFVKPLPERDVDRVWAERVGRFGSDAMLYCDESWAPNRLLHLDARGMSDGTLRFIAIVASLLTVKPGSLLIIEEIDNGLHPSRANELVKVLEEINFSRSVDVLCTTHNPVLIDALGNRLIPFISYISRDSNGDSIVSLVEDVPDLARLMSNSSIGGLMINDRLK